MANAPAPQESAAQSIDLSGGSAGFEFPAFAGLIGLRRHRAAQRFDGM
ncbi:MAG: hypothetical protein ACYDAE_10450 [Steroidobacteraceae bacterium]